MPPVNPFHAGEPFISPSLNRVRVFEVPGETVPANGASGYDLLGKRAIEALIVGHARKLRVASDGSDLLRAFDHCFASEEDEVRTTAVAIATRIGRRLGSLLLALLTADSRSRAARPEWGAVHWAYWRSIRSVWLGGGVVAGRMGVIAARTATEVLHGRGLTDVAVQRAEHAAVLPLWGVARSVVGENMAVPVLDFGHTATKRGCARMVAGRVSEVVLFPAVATVIAQTGWRPTQSIAEIEVLAARLTELIGQTMRDCQRAGFAVGNEVAAAMACYLRDGHPPATEMSYYGRLQRLSDNVRDDMGERVSAALGFPVRLHLIHDATAAAMAFAGQSNTAVITLGTALGIGFPPVTGA